MTSFPVIVRTRSRGPACDGGVCPSPEARMMIGLVGGEGSSVRGGEERRGCSRSRREKAEARGLALRFSDAVFYGKG